MWCEHVCMCVRDGERERERVREREWEVGGGGRGGAVGEKHRPARPQASNTSPTMSKKHGTMLVNIEWCCSHVCVLVERCWFFRFCLFVFFQLPFVWPIFGSFYIVLNPISCERGPIWFPPFLLCIVIIMYVSIRVCWNCLWSFSLLFLFLSCFLRLNGSICS